MIALVEERVFAGKRKLSELERNLVVSGAFYMGLMSEQLADTAPNEEVFHKAMEKMHNEIEQYSRGPLSKLHNFYCDNCSKGLPHGG